MINKTPFLNGFSALLFGRPAVSDLNKLLRKMAALNSLSDLFGALGHLVPGVLLQKSAKGAGSRQRLFPTHLTFWAFLSQVLVPGSSCRDALRRIQAWSLLVDPGKAVGSSSTSGYNQARARLKDQTLESIHTRLVDRMEGRIRAEQLWLGRAVRIVDGTSLSMSDTPSNQALYPQSSSQKPGCGFPVLKMVGIFSLASGALLHFGKSNNQVHEGVVFRGLIAQLNPGEVVLADRGFCSYQTLHELSVAKVDAVMRLHGARKPDLSKAKRLAANEFLITWNKPASRPAGASQQDYDALPMTMQLRLVRLQVSARGFRTQTLWLVTTLLDTEDYPLEALGELYLKRWSVELHFREIKITLGMDVLRCESPEMVAKEVAMHVIGYNVVRALMQEASMVHCVPLARISFKGALDTMRHWSNSMEALRANPRKQKMMLDTMLRLIADDLLPERPGREEPRAKKRRPKNYQLLTSPRKSMPYMGHRNRPKTLLT